MVEVEVWSDVACPWCYLGKRRLEKAIDAFDGDVQVTWKSFQLDPSIPHGEHTPHAEALAKKFNAPEERIREMNQRLVDLGAEEGIEYRFDDYIQANTRDAHRLLHLAQTRGLGGQMKDRLLRAQFSEGAVVDDHETLARLGAEVGLEGDEVRAMLAAGSFDAEVQADIDEAASLGASGVPFFVFDRAFAVSGAQPVEVFETALTRAQQRAEAVVLEA